MFELSGQHDTAADPFLSAQKQRANLWRNGFRPVAVHNATTGDPKTGKRPFGDEWQIRARMTPPGAITEPAHPGAGNTGILCDGLRAVDVDVDDPSIAADVRDFVLGVFGETIVRTRAQSGRCLLVYRASDGQPVKRVLTGKAGKVEILGRGQQFVSYGDHYTGARLEWLDGSPDNTALADLPVVTERQIDALFLALAEIIWADPPLTMATATAPAVSSHGATADIMDVTAALMVIPNTGLPDWEAWNRVLMATWAATGGSAVGLASVNAWSSLHPDYDEDATLERWSHFSKSPPGSVGAGTIFWLAKQARPDWSKPSDIASRTSAAQDFGALEPEASPYVAPGRAKGIRLLSPGQCESADGRKYLIKGLLAERDLACLFAAPAAGKSIIAPHIAYALAQGRAVFGRRVKAGGVFYVAAEDSHGMRQRITGLKMTHGDAPGFSLVEGVGSLLDGGQADELRALVAEHRPTLIMIDTLAMSFPGIDENTSAAMGLVVAVARSLTEYGSAVVLIHHDTKAADGTPRGHSLLNGALDVSIMLGKSDDKGVIRAKLVKNRNGPCDSTMAFRIRSVAVGQDEDGDDITAPVCLELSEVGAAPAKLTRTATKALSILAELVKANGGEPVPETAWRDVCDDQRISGSDERKSRTTAFRRAFESLLDNGRVAAGGGLVELKPGCTESPLTEFDALAAEDT